LHDTNIEQISHILNGKQIALVCGGGIAAIEMPRVARELRRHGASVQFVVTQKCLGFVGITSLEWSSQNPVVIEPTGLSEHISTFDAILVAPATADIISSARHGLCQNGATTLLQSAFGMQIPVGFVPTMHQSLWDSPLIQENYEALKNLKNVFFLNSRTEEQKQKIPPPDQLALTFAHYVNRLTHKNKKPVFITLGGTRVLLDPVRFIANRSTGKLGWETVKLFYGMGHDTTVLAAQTDFKIAKLQNLKVYTHKVYSEIYEFFSNFDFNHIHALFHFLAGSDYEPDKVMSKKFSSEQSSLSISLKSVKKLRDVKNIQKIPYKFLCKLTSEYDVKSKAHIRKLMYTDRIQSLLWNTSEDAWDKKNTHKGQFVVRTNKRYTFTPVQDKKVIAQKLYEEYSSTQEGD